MCHSFANLNFSNIFLSISLIQDLPHHLMIKLRIIGWNAAFRLTREVDDVGSQLIIVMVIATFVYCVAILPPQILEISRTITVMEEKETQLANWRG